MAEVENPANIPIRARAAKNCQTLVDSPMTAVNTAIAQLERNSDNFRPCRSAIRPHTGDANAATKEVAPVIAPLQIATPWTVFTPSPGSIKGTIGLRKLKDPVIRN
jgi:hypothetical protein